MKKSSFIFLIFLLVLCLSAPVYADSLLILGKPAHWAQKYIDELGLEYDMDSVFKDADLNDFITTEDFQKAVRLFFDENYEGSPDSTLREAVVYEFTRLWAEKTGISLDEIATIKMIIYTDTEEIDPKYNHAITIAYMKDIAKGRGYGIFDPKTKTTYGELATLLYNTEKAIKAETKPGIPSIVAGKLETRASCEVLDNKVVFDFELFSHHTRPLEVTFSSGQQFELTITDESGNEVYRYSDGKFFTLALVNKTINPGESLKWQDEWDMTNKDGVKLTTGKYKAVINILTYGAEGEKFDDSELTATIDFSLDK
jgi:hypothetical protein